MMCRLEAFQGFPISNVSVFSSVSRLQSVFNCLIGVTWFRDYVCNTRCEEAMKALIVCERRRLSARFPSRQATTQRLRACNQ